LEINLTTPALLFSTISLLLLAYTNRFLAIARVIRELYAEHQSMPNQRYAQQIGSLRRRVGLVRDMQSLGVASLLICTVCMMLLFVGWNTAGAIAFAVSLLLMAASLALSIVEIRSSVVALNLHLADMAASNETIEKQSTRWWTRYFRFSVGSLIWMSVLVAITMLWIRDRNLLAKQQAQQTSMFGYRQQSGWSIDQILAEPDTRGFGDLPTAWTTTGPDSGEQWVVVEFAKTMPVTSIDIHETHGPGAVIKLSSVSMTGAESTIWTGTDPLASANVKGGVSTISLQQPVSTRRIKIVLDTNLVGGWNEIDAVAIVDAKGNKQWVSQSWASNSFGKNRSLPSWFWP
jgi:hypothetical protein